MSKESKSLLIFLCFNLLLGCGRKEQRTPSIRTIELSAIKDTARSADFRLQLVYRAASMAQSDTASAFAEALRQFELEENDMLGALQNQFINDRTDNMVYIPAGRFLAGGFGEFTGEPKDTLLAPFYIDRYLVTNREYAEFLNQYGNQIDGGKCVAMDVKLICTSLE